MKYGRDILRSLYGDDFIAESACVHIECPYKYCPHHYRYDENLEVICAECIPNPEWGDTVEGCMSYLDI